MDTQQLHALVGAHVRDGQDSSGRAIGTDHLRLRKVVDAVAELLEVLVELWTQDRQVWNANRLHLTGLRVLPIAVLQGHDLEVVLASRVWSEDVHALLCIDRELLGKHDQRTVDRALRGIIELDL